ncbi:peptidyl-prolyl cis-trans isomerase [Cupriavidus gilardii]|uniref:peptidylprolyl isomerase n=1 Tax=Cupriavidus gilardii TaxID=82541 RepID=UPI001ABE4E62|nr:peptidyl-prolyl cis-trans isomerase [Cupriavidus gilardii]MBO4123215.1 peptidyl-prolyl cis-trans isomerase [Cupriavidus gilardii]
MNHLQASLKASLACLAAAALTTTAPMAVAANKSQPEAKVTSKPAAEGALPAGVVARVNGVAISEEQLQQALKALNTPETPVLRESVKNQLIARELFRQAAEKRNYDVRPGVKAAMEQAKTTAMMQEYLRDAVKPQPVSEADVRAKFDAIVATLGEFEIKPSAIVVKDAAAAQTVLEQLRKGTDFAQLARQYGQGPSAAQGGALNWVSFKLPLKEGNTQNWPMPLAQALTQLPEGGVAPAPVQLGDSFWILRVDAKRPTQVPPYDQIKGPLRAQLEQLALQKATEQVVVELMKSARIQQ